jgi:hypothetical protein
VPFDRRRTLRRRTHGPRHTARGRVAAALMCVFAVLCGASTRCLGLSTPTPSTVCRCPWCLLACRLALVRYRPQRTGLAHRRAPAAPRGEVVQCRRSHLRGRGHQCFQRVARCDIRLQRAWRRSCDS